MSFASGFFNTAADRVTERKKYIRDKNAKDRDYLMTYGTQAVRKTEEEANKAITIGKLLEGRGMTKENINFLVDTSGPQGLAIFYNTIKDFKPNELSTKQLNEYVIMAEDYRPSGTTYNDMIKKSFGLYKNSVTDNPEKNEERGMWSFLGLDANAANSSMTDTYAGGYSGYDYKRIMGSSAPSLKAPLPVDRSLLPKVYDPNQNREMLGYIEDEILNIGRKAYEVSSDDYAKLTKEQREFNAKVEVAVASKDTQELLNLLPDTSQAVMDYEKMFPGALTNNPFWTRKYMNFSFGDDAEPIVTGANAKVIDGGGGNRKAIIKANYDKIKENDSSIPPMSEIVVYSSEDDAFAVAEAGTWVQINGKFMKTPSDEIATTPIEKMSIEDMSETMKDIMGEWEKDNPKPAERLGEAALKFWETKRDRYSVKEQNKLTESEETLSETSDVAGSIVDTDQEAFDKEIRKLVDERLLKIPDADPNDIATMIAYRVRRTNPKWKDLTPTKIQKD